MRVKQLAGMTPIETLESLLKEILNVDELCAPCPSAAVKYQSLLKNLYDCVQILCRRKVGTLASIIVEGFDDESIWEQLQTRNAPLLKFAQRAQRKLKKRLDGTRTSTQSDYAEMGDLDIQNSESEGSSGGDHDGDGDEEMPGQVGSDEENSSVFDEGRDDYIDESDGSDAPEGENESEEMDEEARMEAYLDRADELEMERQYRAEKRGGDIEDDDGEGSEAEDLRFVRQALYDSDEDDEEQDSGDEGTAGAEYKFSDFFVADKPRKGGKSKSSATESKSANKRSRDDGEGEGEASESDVASDEEGSEADESRGDGEDEDGEDWEDGEEDEEGEEQDDVNFDRQGRPGQSNGKPADPKPRSRRDQALASQIAELEEELVAEKPWELRGEVKGSDRPENSFLDLHADIERISKPAPIVTQAFTSSMEEMIKRRIKEGNFSDVLPPPPRKDVDKDRSDETELSQEKNKLGLGEVYAEDFLAKSLNAQPEAVSKRLEQDRAEAQDLFHKISRQLDALSHFHFTPRPVVADVKLKSLQPAASAVAALQLEDITPVTALTAGASQLAPEQVLQKKRGIEASMMTEEEMTAEDKKRKRRASKAANKAKKQRAADESMVSATSAASPAAAAAKAKAESRVLDEELRRDSRVTLTTAGGGKKGSSEGKSAGIGSLAKSSNFFSKLQQESNDKIKLKSGTSKAKAVVKNPFAGSVNAFKL